MSAIVLDVGTSVSLVEILSGCSLIPITDDKSWASAVTLHWLIWSNFCYSQRYSGEDTPKAIVPSSYGYVPANGDQPARSYFGHAGPSIWRPHQQVLNPLQDSMIVDWTSAEALISHVFSSGLRLDSLEEHPLLVTEPAWNTKENREKMTELAFEQFKTPAFYSADRAVLAAFASGKGTALVLDVGEDSSSVIPIYDGFVLRKGRSLPILCLYKV